ncbi:MAG: prenyltransferase [Granulosicoccaceae bacterium]
MKQPEHYRFIRALRPFSLVVALVSSALGVLLAWQDGFQNPWHALWVFVGAILAQAGVNLVNDVEDLPLLGKGALDSRRQIVFNARIAMLFFVLAFLIGLYFYTVQGWEVLALVVIVALLALSYNLGPIHFKNRGLALIQVFLLMGVCLVEGAYLAMSGQFSVEAFYLSLPISVLVSLLLLSNELRDWENDSVHGAGTLTVRIGYTNATRLYAALTALAYCLAIGVLGAEQLSLAWLLLIPAPLLLPIAGYLRAPRRPQLTPMTGRFFFLFGLAWLAIHWRA